MMNMESSSRNPYETSAWETFADQCYDEGVEPTEEAYDAWVQEQYDAAEDAAVERYLDFQMERDDY